MYTQRIKWFYFASFKKLFCCAVALGLAAMAQAENPANDPAVRDNLVVEYRFDGDAGDTSGNGRHAELRGQPGFVKGKHGQCLTLNGQEDYAEPPARPRVSLDGEWEFRLDPQREGEAGKWFEPSVAFPDKIQVPGNWQAQGFGEPIRLVRHNYQGIAWYRRTFEVPPVMAGKRIQLKFQAVCNNGEVYVNGHHVGRIETFITPYEFDVTDLVHPGPNTLVVRVDSGSTDEIARNNLETGDPASANGYVGMIQFLVKWGGIIGKVELSARPAIALEDLVVLPNVADRKAAISFSVRRSETDGDWSGKALVEVMPSGADAKAWKSEVPVRFAAGAAETGPVRAEVAMPDMRLWSPEDPFLYDVRVTLEKDGKTADVLSDRTGMREFAVGGGEGAFVLNGKPYFLRGLGYDSIEPITGTPMPDKAIYVERLKHIKDLGFNCVRFLAHTPFREFFDAADEVGVLVQAEGENFMSGFPMPPEAAKLLAGQVPRIIREHRNHPSWYAFSCMNECGYLTPADFDIKRGYIDSAHRTFKELDPTRYFLASDHGGTVWPTDIITGRGDMDKAMDGGAAPAAQVFGGELDQFGYFRRALAEADMAALAAAPPDSPDAAKALDSLKPDGHWQGAAIAKGADLADKAAALLVGDNAPFSASIWVKPKGFAVGDFGTPFSFGAAETGQGLLVSLDGYAGKGQILVGHYNQNGLTSKTALSPNVWNHVGVSFDGEKLRLFINGKPDSEIVTNLTVAPRDLKIGSLINRPLHPAADFRSRPHVWHEFNGTYIAPLPDMDKERKLVGGVISQEHNLLERHRARMAALGLLERYPEVRKISVASYFEYIKQAFEGARLMPNLDGYHWWVISDIPSGFECDVTDLGVLDMVYQPDKFPDPGVFRPFNSASVLLIDADVDRRVLADDERKVIGVSVSHFGADSIKDGRLSWQLTQDGKPLRQGELSGITAANGQVTKIGSIELEPTNADSAMEMVLEVKLQSSAGTQSNAWKFWVFPRQKRSFAGSGIVNLTGVAKLDERYATGGQTSLTEARLALADHVTPDLLAFVANGGTAILLERNPELSARMRQEVMMLGIAPTWNASRILKQSVPIPFWPRWIRCNANIVENHPALQNFPHGDFPDFQMARLYGVNINAADLSDPVLKEKLRPIVWGLYLDDTKTPVPNFRGPQEFFQGAALGEARFGKGRLIHCGLWLADGIERGLPEASYLLDSLVDYALSNKPADLPVLTNEEAHKVFLIENLPAKNP